MKPRRLERVLASSVSFVLSATFSAFVVALAEKDSAHFPYYTAVVIAAIVLAFSLSIAWGNHSFRCSVLSVRQGFLHFLIALVLGIFISSLSTSVILFFNLIMPVTSKGFRLISIGTAILLAVQLLVTPFIWGALTLFSKRTIWADQCYAVLRHIDRERVLGRYNFVLGATVKEIRRESRILDYLAHSHPELVKRRVGGRYTLPPYGAPAAETIPGDAPSRVQKSQPGEQTEKDLAAIANVIWQAGGNGAWRTAGREVQAIEFKEVFGNQLDELFNRGKGFESYGAGGPRFVTLVIKGAPGAGKSTLALQMSVTLARQGNVCLYYSLEEEREALLQNAQNFGWKDSALLIKSDNADTVHYRGVQRGASQEEIATDPSPALETAREGVVLVSSLGGRAMSLEARKRRLHQTWGRKHTGIYPLPEVACSVVIDSLEGFANVGLEQRGTSGVSRDEVLGLKDFFRDRCRLLIILVEDDNTGTPGYVDFVADVVIQLGRKVEAGYVILFAEILKARNQTHSLGQHQVKIRSQQDLTLASEANKAKGEGLKPGLVVFPSLHYRLFQAHQEPTFDTRGLKTGFDGLDSMLSAIRTSGLIRQSATALLGISGTGKSLIGMNFLIEGIRENVPTLLLSLRDTEGLIRSRSTPQQADKIRFAWHESEGTEQHWYHQFEWRLDAIAKMDWSQPPLFQLPYLFSWPHLLSDKEMQTWKAETSQALRSFFTSLAEAFQEKQNGERMWTPPERTKLERAYQSIWEKFVQTRILHSPAETWLLQAKNPHTMQIGPKRLELRFDRAGSPLVYWDSQEWDSKQEKIVFNTSLLKVLTWRPGYISPEEFCDLVLRELKGKSALQKYERVVLDDVSQLRGRFPLLANSPIFLAALIDLFKANGVTSLFLEDIEQGKELISQHGITAMVEQVIRTSIVETPSPRLRGAINSDPLSRQGFIGGQSKPSKPASKSIRLEVESRPGISSQFPWWLEVTDSSSDSTAEARIVSYPEPEWERVRSVRSKVPPS